MADADLDLTIRRQAKQQQKVLMEAVRKRRDHYAALAAKAKDTDSKQRYRQLAKDVLEIGTATVKRLQMSADNAAYSYASSIRRAVEAAAAPKKAAPAKAPAPVKKAAEPATTPPKKAAKKAAAKPVKKPAKQLADKPAEQKSQKAARKAAPKAAKNA
ncbi:MAG TPA: hypothetical protein VNZ94_13800 [Xanthobacteraceae bacterium]|nr:hypothetical protein [Xanthobacteraceae bacterium]